MISFIEEKWIAKSYRITGNENNGKVRKSYKIELHASNYISAIYIFAKNKSYVLSFLFDISSAFADRA